MRAKKSLGQNFLNSTAALLKMIKAAKLTDKDIVLEIGPGKGVLTKELLKNAEKVVAIEKDKDLIPILEEKFKKEIRNNELVLINDDALKIDLKKLGLKNEKYKIVANIPYYITGQILRRFLENETRPSLAVFLVQKEVAERISRSKKESLLSLSVRAFGKPKYMATVPKNAFVPVPKVDSAILLIDEISNANFKCKKEQEHFFSLIHAAFSQKRKFAINNIKKSPRTSTWVPGTQVEKRVGEIFEKCGVGKKTRAEDISLKQWLSIQKHLEPIQK